MRSAQDCNLHFWRARVGLMARLLEIICCLRSVASAISRVNAPCLLFISFWYTYRITHLFECQMLDYWRDMKVETCRNSNIFQQIRAYMLRNGLFLRVSAQQDVLSLKPVRPTRVVSLPNKAR